MKVPSLTLLGMLCATHANAAPLVPGLQHDPPRFVDESSTWVKLLGQGADGYHFDLEATITDYVDGNRVRADWKQGGKLLASTKCKFDRLDVGSKLGLARCHYGDKPLKATGAIDVDLVYEDDKDDKHYLVRTYKVAVKQWAPNTWQLAADDLLAGAYIRHIEREHQLELGFWLANKIPAETGTLRCTVDGKAITDLQTDLISDTELEADILPAKGERTTWTWTLVRATPYKTKWGPKAQSSSEITQLADHPGRWSCQLRVGGNAIRGFKFAVDAHGTVEPHPMQSAKGAPPLLPSVAAIEIEIPKNAGVDQRIKPDLLRKSRGFGLAWPDEPGVKAMLAALPPAVENAHPKPAPAPKGKRLSGLEHSPPRFIDEPTALVRVRRRGDGYSFTVSASMTGKGPITDRVRVEWKQRGKLLAIGPCERGEALTCSYDDKPLTAIGPIDADLIYADDVDGNEYLVRTFHVQIAKFPSFGDPVYQVVGDDLLGSAWVRHDNDLGGEPLFLFWIAQDLSGLDMKLRCTVDGAAIDDIALSPEHSASLEANTNPRTGKSVHYVWSRVRAHAAILWGPKDPKQPDAKRLADHPGKWDCVVRNQGKPIRELLFTVGADGMIAQGAIQSGKGASPTFDDVAEIEMRIPKDAGFDLRLRPDAIRKSRNFGLPWPEHPSVKSFFASLPPASGLPDPK